jgi:hypothetical protein
MMIGRIVAIATVALSLAPELAHAQGSRGLSAIAGVVKDDSGAVIPGVSVEASSPARWSTPGNDHSLRRQPAR